MSTTVDPLPASAFRHAIGHFTSGVTVLTTRSDGQDFGATASAVTSLSMEPPMLLVCVNLKSATQRAIEASGSFGVNILSADQGPLAARFATSIADKFEGVAYRRGELGMALLDGALAQLECTVSDTIIGGTHRVFLAEVRTASVRDGDPLAYYRGQFGRFGLTQDDDALDRVHRLVLRRSLPLEEPLDPQVLAVRLEVPVTSVLYALTRLLADHLVERRAATGFFQVPVDVERCDAAFEAKRVIDAGAAVLAIERAHDAELEALVATAAAMPSSDVVTDAAAVDGYVAANDGFHEQMIALAANPALLDAYRRLNLPGIMTQVLGHRNAESDELVNDHLLLAGAMRERDLGRVQELLETHHRRGLEAYRAAIESSGGRI